MPDEKTEAIKYWKVTADGIDNLGMFHQCSLPSMSLTAQDFKVWDKQGKPNPLPVGVQASFGDVTLMRGVDKQAGLWEWISKVAQQGATPETVKDVSLIACDAKSQPVQTWVLKQAYPSSYQATGMAAAGTDVLTESISIHYTDATLDTKGGLTGSV